MMKRASWLYWLGIGLAVSGCALPAADKNETRPAQQVGIAAPSARDAHFREMFIDWKLHSLRNDSKKLHGFLLAMPKGADLHSHLSGAVTTERLIEWGAEDGLCINRTTWTAEPPPCKDDSVSLAKTKSDPALYQNVLAAWSMANFNGPLLAAHQHFFDAFGKFGAVISEQRGDDALADVLSLAGRNQQLYIELMQGFDSSTIGKIAAQYIKPGDAWTEKMLLEKRKQIIADPLFQPTLNKAVANMDSAVQGARKLLGCGTADSDPGCNVEVRFLMSANRTKDRAYVFAQWVYGYELTQQSPQVLGVELVSPEEDANSLKYYDDEMFALDVLHRFNQTDKTRRPVRIALHAGELIPEVLPPTPEGQQHLKFHIRHAVVQGHAERIGHGCDVLNEDSPTDLLKTMRDKDVLAEICLTSNATLLGKTGYSHPVNVYLAQDVPASLSTDDEGILRINITDEFIRAVTLQQLGYPELKQMVRASVEHSFLPGASLWKQASRYDQVTAACAQDDLGAEHPSVSCAKLLTGSERAAMQWKLEGQLAAFEDKVARQQ
jgi:adenosine deaminase